MSTSFGIVLWRIPLYIMAVLVLFPILVVVLSWHAAETEIWQHLIATGLGRLLKNTFFLVVGVGVLVTFLGVSLAWLTSSCEFPGRSWLDWALMLPLAIPTYVVAFVVLGIMSYGGPVLTFWRLLFGSDAWYPDIRQTFGVVIVLSMVLYPYVYMLARSAFLSQGRSHIETARVLGLGPWGSFFRVALPMARPAIIAGLSLALMETLADFGAVSVFNFDTFTTAIYKSWFGFFNLQAAAQLASLLLLFVGLALYAENYSRGKRRHFSTTKRDYARTELVGMQRVGASIFCFGVFFIAFVIPVLQLALWFIKSGGGGIDAHFLNLVWHTFLLGTITACVVVSMSLVASYSEKLSRSRHVSVLSQFASLGYALPGSVLAVGIMVAFSVLDRSLFVPLINLLGVSESQFLLGSLFSLLVAYTIRFYSVGLGPVRSSFDRIKPHYQEVAQTQGYTRWEILRRIYVPLLAPGMLSAAVLVLVDTMKEMPATLLLRPFGWDTLAVRVYEMTSEGEWERAALPALVLISVSIIPVIIMIRQSRKVV